jgi:hypothetical protein
VCPELGRASDELGELGSVEYKLKEELDVQDVEVRGIDPGHEILQVFANPRKPHFSKS